MTHRPPPSRPPPGGPGPLPMPVSGAMPPPGPLPPLRFPPMLRGGGGSGGGGGGPLVAAALPPLAPPLGLGCPPPTSPVSPADVRAAPFGARVEDHLQVVDGRVIKRRDLADRARAGRAAAAVAVAAAAARGEMRLAGREEEDVVGVRGSGGRALYEGGGAGGGTGSGGGGGERPGAGGVKEENKKRQNRESAKRFRMAQKRRWEELRRLVMEKDQEINRLREMLGKVVEMRGGAIPHVAASLGAVGVKLDGSDGSRDVRLGGSGGEHHRDGGDRHALGQVSGTDEVVRAENALLVKLVTEIGGDRGNDTRGGGGDQMTGIKKERDRQSESNTGERSMGRVGCVGGTPAGDFGGLRGVFVCDTEGVVTGVRHARKSHVHFKEEMMGPDSGYQQQPSENEQMREPEGGGPTGSAKELVGRDVWWGVHESDTLGLRFTVMHAGRLLAELESEPVMFAYRRREGEMWRRVKAFLHPVYVANKYSALLVAEFDEKN